MPQVLHASWLLQQIEQLLTSPPREIRYLVSGCEVATHNGGRPRRLEDEMSMVADKAIANAE